MSSLEGVATAAVVPLMTTQLQLASSLTSALHDHHTGPRSEDKSDCASKEPSPAKNNDVSNSPANSSTNLSDNTQPSFENINPKKCHKSKHSRHHRQAVYHINPPPGFDSPLHIRAGNQPNNTPPELSESSDSDSSSTDLGSNSDSPKQQQDVPRHLPSTLINNNKPTVSLPPARANKKNSSPNQLDNNNQQTTTTSSLSSPAEARKTTTTSAHDVRNSSTFWDVSTLSLFFYL